MLPVNTTSYGITVIIFWLYILKRSNIFSSPGGAAWPWTGAALAKTNKIVIGTGVTSPILRYHPAIVASKPL